jgi:aldose 1-epimerase
MKQRVWIDADTYTRADEGSIPTGEFTPVKGTPMDFTVMKPIEQDINGNYEALIFGGGYDHNWVLNHPQGEVSLCAASESDKTGIRMEVYTDLPGIQFYTANFLKNGMTGKGGAVYEKRCCYCFETQYYPDSVNKPEFQSPVLKAGEEYKTTTIYKFSNLK